jgi:hypothetical protein
MYQQLRCLNTIRKSFYREKFYPSLMDNLFQSQKSKFDLPYWLKVILLTKGFQRLDDCFDFLRQTIQCHGDVSMIYFSNESYGMKVSSDSFENPELIARTKRPSVNWDVEHSCRALEPIEEWVAAHQGTEGYGVDF